MSRARLVPSPVLYICSTVYDELKILYDADVSQSREIGFVKLYFRRNMEVYSSLGSAVGPSFALVDRNSDHQTSHLIMLYIHIGLSQVIFSLDLRFVVTRGMIILQSSTGRLVSGPAQQKTRDAGTRENARRRPQTTSTEYTQVPPAHRRPSVSQSPAISSPSAHHICGASTYLTSRSI